LIDENKKKRNQELRELASDMPCINCLLYPVCINRFKSKCKDRPGVIFDIIPVDSLKTKCSLLDNWCDREILYIRNRTHEAIYNYFLGKLILA